MKEKTTKQKAQETALAIAIFLFCLFADAIYEAVLNLFI